MQPSEQIPRKGGPARATSVIGVPLSRPKSMEEVKVTDELGTEVAFVTVNGYVVHDNGRGET